MSGVGRARRAAIGAGRVALAVAACAIAASAFAGDEYVIVWSTLDGGGGLLTGGEYEVMATIGQPESGSVLSADGVELIGGYWVAAAPPERAPCAADFNRDGFIDFFDYDGYVGAFESGGPGADFNRDGFLDFFDYDEFVRSFETGC